MTGSSGETSRMEDGGNSELLNGVVKLEKRIDQLGQLQERESSRAVSHLG